MSQKILVPIGMNEMSKSVIRFACDLAIDKDMHLVFLHVTPEVLKMSVSLTGIYGESNVNDFIRESTSTIERQFEAYLKSQKIEKEYTLLHKVGVPQDEIVNVCESIEPEFLVMGSHDQSSFERLFLGSTADYVLHHVNIPVFLYKGTYHELENEILVPIDFSEPNVEIVFKADAFAQQTGAKLVLLHVDTFIPYYQTWAPEIYGANSLMTSKHEKEVTLKLRQKLEKYAEDLYLKSDYTVEVIKGNAGLSILEYQKEHRFRWIFIAPHSHNFFDRVILGSTTDYLVHHAHCAFYLGEKKAKGRGV